MASLHVLPKSTHGPLDADRAVIRAMSMVNGISVPMPVMFGGKKPIAQVGWDPASRNVWCAPFISYDDMINKVTQSTPKTFAGFMMKSPLAVIPATNIWADFWPCASGDPDGGTYPGAAATAYVASPSVDPGFPSLGPVPGAGETKHLTGIYTDSFNAAGLTIILYDRVLVYNACAVVNALTNMTNSVPATRYSGKGVQIMVTSQVVLGGAVNLTAISYQNQSNATKAYTGGTQALSAGLTGSATSPSQVITPNPFAPFVPLAAGDSGVQIINSWTCSAAQTGSICFVLARPIAMLCYPIFAQGVQMETVRNQFNLFPLANDACLSLLVRDPNGTGDNNIEFNFQVAWG